MSAEETFAVLLNRKIFVFCRNHGGQYGSLICAKIMLLQSQQAWAVKNNNFWRPIYTVCYEINKLLWFVEMMFFNGKKFCGSKKVERFLGKVLQ